MRNELIGHPIRGNKTKNDELLSSVFFAKNLSAELIHYILYAETNDFSGESKYYKKEDKEDDFRLYFDGLIEKAFDNTFHLFIQFDLETVKGKRIAVITVRSANRPVFVKIKTTLFFYVRRTVSTVWLDHQQTAAYVLEKWHHLPASIAGADIFESETNFRLQLKIQFDQKGSVLREEISNNWNSYSLIAGNTFMKAIIVDNL